MKPYLPAVSSPAVNTSAAIFKPNGESWFGRGLAGFIACLGAVAMAALLVGPRFVLPAEDAVILFQFSRNLAQTGAISFVPFGPHAEGATDFAWMVLLSLGIKCGIDAFWLVALVNVASLALLSFLLVKLAKCPVTPFRFLFVMGAFALTPQIFAAAAGFSTLPFACILVLLAFCFLRRSEFATPVVGLVLCLFRPDGIVFAGPVLLAALVIDSRRLRRFALDICLFLLPGLIYFLWRWHYFGEILPLPFLVKSNAHRFAHLFVLASVRQGMLLSLFSLALLWRALRGRMHDVRNQAILLCFIVLPSLFYFEMRLDQNLGHRFFIYLPVAVALLLAINWQTIRQKFAMFVRFAMFAWLLFLSRPWVMDARQLVEGQMDNRKAIAQDLSTLPHGTVIVTEAGIVPYYSHWHAYDAWGLNTVQFAKRLFQPSDVKAIDPDLILAYTGGDVSCVRKANWNAPYSERTWQNLTRNIIAGADPSHYELWLVPYGSSRLRAAHKIARGQGDQECWLVRRDSRLRDGIDGILARHGGLTIQQYRKTLPPDRHE